MKIFNYLCSLILIFFFYFFFGIDSFAVELNLPSNLIAFNSPMGIKIFNQASEKKDYWTLSQYFITQKNQAFCSIASLVMVLNASGIAKPVTKPYAPYSFFTQSNFLTAKILKIVTIKQIDHHGLTLDQLKSVANTFPLEVKSVHTAADKPDSLALFRTTAKKALANGTQFIIVNFYRKNINELGAGHFSPLAAYDAKTDRFLLMDVARYKYPPVWVKAETLWKAMNTIDSSSKKNRGYLIISPKRLSK